MPPSPHPLPWLARSSAPGALLLAGLLLLPGGLLAGVRHRAAPSEHHDSPTLVVLEGQHPLRPGSEYPSREPLARFHHFRVLDVHGGSLGRLVHQRHTTLPAWSMVGNEGQVVGAVTLDRRPGRGFVLQNEGYAAIGRLVRLRITHEQYEWQTPAGDAIGAIVPRRGHRFWEVRGGDELRALLERLGYPPVTERAREAGRASRERRERFQALHRRTTPAAR